MWDLDLVAVELSELVSMNYDIELTGFDESDLVTGPVDGLTDPDDVPEAQEEAVTKFGDAHSVATGLFVAIAPTLRWSSG